MVCALHQSEMLPCQGANQHSNDPKEETLGTITCTFGPNKHRSPMRMVLQSRNTQLKFTYTSRPAEGSRWGMSVGRHTSSASAEGGRRRTKVNIEALRSSAHAMSAVALQMPCPGSARQHVAC